MEKWTKELQQVDFKPATLNKLYLYDVEETFFETLDFSPLDTKTTSWSEILLAFHKIIWLKIRFIFILNIGDIFSWFIHRKKTHINNVPKKVIASPWKYFQFQRRFISKNLFLKVEECPF